MKETIQLAVLSTIAAVAFYIPVQAQAAEDLIYVSVEPCRIVNTRKSFAGPVNADTFRNFLVAGTAQELAVQGGTVNCLNPKGAEKPAAISAYIIAVPAASSTGRGVLTAYPSNQPTPPLGAGSTVNFGENQTIGNTTNVTICTTGDTCPFDGELAILARSTDEDVIVDVQGYYYPASSISSCNNADSQGNWQTFVADGQDWSSCKMTINGSGAIVSGTCSSSGGPGTITAGQLQINSGCEVWGELYVDGERNKIQAARLSADSNSITGIVTVGGYSTTFNGVRYR